MMKVTMLIDNRGDEALFRTEWGLSAFIEYNGHRILLDTGSSDQFAQNAETLGISLEDVEFGVLSHAHYDHADGLPAFFTINHTAPFYLQEGSEENCYGLNEDRTEKYIGIRKGILAEYNGRIRYVSGVTGLMDGVSIVPHRREDYSAIAIRSGLFQKRNGALTPDEFLHEQSLVFDTEGGLVVMNSCSHTGIGNILSEVRAAFPGKRMRALIGGLHLYKMTDPEIEAVAERIRAEQIETVFTGHCTGDHPFEYLRELLGGGVQQFETGMVLEF